MTAIKADFIAAKKFALPKFTTITNKKMLNLKIYHKNNAKHAKTMSSPKTLRLAIKSRTLLQNLVLFVISTLFAGMFVTQPQHSSTAISQPSNVPFQDTWSKVFSCATQKSFASTISAPVTGV